MRCTWRVWCGLVGDGVFDEGRADRRLAFSDAVGSGRGPRQKAARDKATTASQQEVCRTLGGRRAKRNPARAGRARSSWGGMQADGMGERRGRQDTNDDSWRGCVSLPKRGGRGAGVAQEPRAAPPHGEAGAGVTGSGRVGVKAGQVRSGQARPGSGQSGRGAGANRLERGSTDAARVRVVELSLVLVAWCWGLGGVSCLVWWMQCRQIEVEDEWGTDLF
jgi:hypothetical protein